MAYGLFNKDIKKDCSSCVYSKRLEFSEMLFCTRKGEVNKFDLCRKYKYSPLNREPQQAKISGNFSKDDFKL